MDNIFSQIVPLTLAMVLPMPMLKATRYLLLGRPVAHLSLFIITWGLTLFITLSIAVYLGNNFRELLYINTDFTPNPIFKALGHIIVGLVLLMFGVQKLKYSIENKKIPMTLNELDANPINIIKSAIKIELIGLKNSSLLILIIYILITNNIATQKIPMIVGIIAIISMSWMSILMIIYFMAGKNRNNIIESSKNWLILNKDVLLIFIYIFIGISSLSSGIGDLVLPVLELFHLNLT